MGARKCRLGLSVLYKNCDSWRRARGIGPNTLFKTKKTADPILQTVIFGQDLNFPILTCRTTSQPINLKHAQHFHIFLMGANGLYPIPLGCKSLPRRPGARLYAPQPRATPQSLQLKVRAPPDQHERAKRRPNPNMMQLESASKTQTAQYRDPRPRLHLPQNDSHE